MSRPGVDTYILGLVFVALIAGASAVLQPFAWGRTASTFAGIAAAMLATAIAWRLRRANPAALIAGVMGSVAGAFIGLLAVFVLRQAGLAESTRGGFLRLIVPLLGAYVGLLVGLWKAEHLPFDFVPLKPVGRGPSVAKILDTSVLIDGRIADIGESGFIEGRLIVPRFVLHELQLVADSSDSAKRNRGRRGLDVVQRLQKLTRIQLEISAQDFPAVREVDLKLIELAKAIAAKIVTNDFNLNKLAQVQGLEVLNINELANALRPVVLPGETMRVFILKEGKEHNQGVAYLDDGTMVVVDNARRMISKTVDVVVTSVLQTTAGKMIFGRYDDRAQSSAASAGTTGH
ncbi:MAG TPA: PIN domain-containing protein [Bryobacteraceae bacterium]|nr:PIN domain-containing protein [Bryobacteraceae bacterium]